MSVQMVDATGKVVDLDNYHVVASVAETQQQSPPQSAAQTQSSVISLSDTQNESDVHAAVDSVMQTQSSIASSIPFSFPSFSMRTHHSGERKLLPYEKATPDLFEDHLVTQFNFTGTL